MTGIHNWHEGCHRYTEADLDRHLAADLRLPSGPTGLGTSAARLRRLVPVS